MSTSVPSLEFVFEIKALIATPRSAGHSGEGERLHIAITGGTVAGPGLNGKVLPGGSDWPLITPAGLSRIDAHYSIEADDGTLIYVHNRGIRVSSAETLAKLRAGLPVESEEVYLRGAPVFDAPDGVHRWLAESLFVCTIEPRKDQVVVRVYRVR